jgi:hypothetical protein
MLVAAVCASGVVSMHGSGCAHLGPILEQVVSRIDVQRVLDCSRAESPADKARCLGVAVLTPAIDVALQRARAAADRALHSIDGPAGSELPTDRAADRRIARELDDALDDLSIAIAEAQ